MSVIAVAMCLVLPTAFGQQTASEDDILVSDFEHADYGAWTVSGDAFGAGPAQGTLPGQMDVSGFLGKGLVNSFVGGDAGTGTLTSPAFTIERPYLNFLIGGGGFEGVTCMNLKVDDEVVHTATGTNVQPGGSERLAWHFWDVSALLGRTAVLEIVDQRTDFWGHINVDHIVQSKESSLMPDLERTLSIAEDFVFLPVTRGATIRRIDVFDGKTLVRSFDIELANGPEDYWVAMEAGSLRGKTLRFQVERPRGSDPRVLDRLVQGTLPPDAGDLYREAFRPGFHFTTQRGWNNDPNGLVYYAGEYHLFYQHNPYGCKWGNMTWGHAVSRDLVRWKELGDAIHPDELGSIFSGSAVVDEANTTGFQDGAEAPLVAIYTYAGGTTHASEGKRFTQALAYSNDRGRSWTKYAGNPALDVLRDGNRDPKVFWHAPTGQWVMVLYLEEREMGFYSSEDLKTWRLESRLTCGFHECPELFELPIDGNPDDTRWVLYGASGDYLLGDFDGMQFTPGGDPVRFHYGNCFYASQTYNNIPKEDGRRIQIAWGTVGHGDMPFNQMMDFPVELTLRSTGEGPRLFVQPVREIETLYARTHTWEDIALLASGNPLEGVSGPSLDIDVIFEIAEAKTVGLEIQGIPVIYDADAKQLRCQGAVGPLEPVDGRIALRVLVDRLSIEIYGNGGALYMPMQAQFGPEADGLKLLSEGESRLVRLTVRELNSAWER